MKGEDIDADLVQPKLEEFVKSNTERAIICFERGDLENHLHVQALMVVATTTPAQFNLSVEKALGYEKGKRTAHLSTSAHWKRDSYGRRNSRVSSSFMGRATVARQRWR